jgi:hypothetical protein
MSKKGLRDVTREPFCFCGGESKSYARSPLQKRTFSFVKLAGLILANGNKYGLPVRWGAQETAGRRPGTV